MSHCSGDPGCERGDRCPDRGRYLAKCVECGRVFDLRDESDAGEWLYGHDCE